MDGKRFTTDEHVIGLDNGKVVRTMNERSKSLGGGWNFDETDKIKAPTVGPMCDLYVRQVGA